MLYRNSAWTLGAIILLGVLLIHVVSFQRGVKKPLSLHWYQHARKLTGDYPATVEHAVVVGSGPIGLATAIMLVQQGGSKVRVFDQLPEPPSPDDASYWGKFRSERSYNIGITGRGQLVLKDLEVWDSVKSFAAEIYGSATWSPETEEDYPSLAIQNRRYHTHCIERDRLTGCLLKYIKDNYDSRIDVSFDVKCSTLKKSTEGELWELEMLNSKTNAMEFVQTSFLVGADGSNSVVRDSLAQNYGDLFQIQKYDEVNEYVYRTVPVVFNCSSVDKFCPSDKFMSYSMRSTTGLNMESLPTVEGVHLGVLLFKPDNRIMKNITTSSDARALFQTYFPVASRGISDQAIERFVEQQNSRFQRFQYVHPNLHFGSSVCLLGDSIHTVKPYFGLSLNSGLEDVGALKRALISNLGNRGAALQQFTNERAKEAKALVKMSQRLDRGFIYFILPLIMDSICNKYAPWLFEKSVVSCMQDESRTFTQILRRKRRDRFVQISFMILVIMAMTHTSKMLIQKLLIPWISRISPAIVTVGRLNKKF